MNTIENIRSRARFNKKTIVLPEYNDSRVREAAGIIESEGIAKIILLNDENIDKEKKERFVEEYYSIRKSKGADLDSVKKLFQDPLYYGAMLVRDGGADGLVAGASHTTADIVRSCIHAFGVDPMIGIACSCFIMDVPDCPYGEQGTFIFADCGIIPFPMPKQIAQIAYASANLIEKILGITPKVALLSYSTKGSAQGKPIDDTRQALGFLKEMSSNLLSDGEMQLDAAIVPEVARIKCPDSPLQGQANVLIFPDLQSGNIGYKLTQRLGRARALGPLILGLNKPASDLSRGCIVEDVIDCVAVTAIRAQ
jgi:phosphate acetyltransferase